MEPTLHLHDVVIIGAGPCGLAIASRLKEPTPAANFTDEEHARYQWLRKHSGKMSIKNRKTGHVIPSKSLSSSTGADDLDMLVLDASGDQWLNRWNELFETFEISHLRSPMFFHVDPAERDGLLSYTHFHGRQSELREIRNCVGKEVSKHHRKQRIKAGRQPQGEPTLDERDRNDYFVPSTTLFASHCQQLVDRYNLREGTIRHAKVVNIEHRYFDEISQAEKVFAVHTNSNQVHYARIVVLAIGPGNPPSIPSCICPGHQEAVTHAMQVKEMPCPRVQLKIKQRKSTNILIIGGGLTSAQLADLAIRRGVTKVWLVMRGAFKEKPFDVGLEWVGKFRNFEQSAFWSADTDEERWEKIKTARNGGSITAPYRKILDRHSATGRLETLLYTTVRSNHWDEAAGGWRVELDGQSHDHALPLIDHIYCATGIQTNFECLPCLQTLCEQYPIPNCGGLPCITDDLKWTDDVPLFVTGRLAGLRLGPGAPNLVGARQGADRVCWSVQDLLSGKDNRDFGTSGDRFNYVTARGNRFDALVAAA